MKLLKKFFNNARKPEGFLGKIMVAGMNGGGHAVTPRNTTSAWWLVHRSFLITQENYLTRPRNRP